MEKERKQERESCKAEKASVQKKRKTEFSKIGSASLKYGCE